MPTARQIASVAPAVVAPRAPWRGARGEVAWADLAGVRRVGEARELVFLEPYLDDAVEHPDRRRDRPGRPHPSLGLRGDGAALAGRKAVRDERRLERDHRPAGLERGPNLGMNADQVGHG